MTASIHQKALYALAAILFGVIANGSAQQAGPALTCSGGSSCPEPPIALAVSGGPAMGGGQIGVVAIGGTALSMQENADVVKNQPYQAKAVTEMQQTLADGSHITQTTNATVARDSDGRTVRIQELSTTGPSKSASDSSQSDGPTLTTIFDPLSQTHTDYTSDRKVAHVLPMPAPPPGATMRGHVRGFAMMGAGPGPEGAGPVTFAVQAHADSGEPGPNPSGRSEQLGTKTIEGISVTGTRTTTTIPTGTIGNDKDLLVTREIWYSADLKLVILSTQTDPRFGETSYTLTNIQRSEPDPTLFQVPAGYKVDNVPAMVQQRWAGPR